MIEQRDAMRRVSIEVRDDAAAGEFSLALRYLTNHSPF